MDTLPRRIFNDKTYKEMTPEELEHMTSEAEFYKDAAKEEAMVRQVDDITHREGDWS